MKNTLLLLIPFLVWGEVLKELVHKAKNENEMIKAGKLQSKRF